MEEIKPLFAREASLARWVALRGAVADLHQQIGEGGAGAQMALLKAMGLDLVDAGDGMRIRIEESRREQLSSEQQEAAFGIASVVLERLTDYPRYSAMSTGDVNADPVAVRVGPAVAFDIIAWTSVALLRLEIAPEYLPHVPEPDLLAEAGWYVEPLFCKAERYWDGSDWTELCRVPDGRGYREIRSPLK